MEMNIPFVPSVNFRKGRTQPQNRGGKATPCMLIVVHYTAGGDFDATVDYLTKKNPAYVELPLMLSNPRQTRFCWV